MRGERLKELWVARAEAWPTFYVATDAHYYEYTGQSFVTASLPATVAALAMPADYVGAKVDDVRGDGESAVVRLENGSLIVFELAHDPFGGQVESHPQVRFVSQDEAQQWQSEYEEMDSI